MDQLAIKQCLTCGHDLNGKYCHACGEKVVDRQEHTLRYFLLQVLNAFTFADTRIWKSVKFLIIRPGRLPREYLDGRRRPYISPLPLFFLINFLYFFIAPFDTFNTRFEGQLNAQGYSTLIHDYGMSQVEKSGMKQETFTRQYNAHSANTSKSIILLLAVFFAVPLMLLFYNRTAFYFDHLMFSLSFVSFLLLGVFIILPYLIMAGQVLFETMNFNASIDWNSGGMVIFGLLVTGAYLGVGLKAFYAESILFTVLKTMALLFSLMFILLFYRFTLFFVTIWTM